MNVEINKSKFSDIYNHLKNCDEHFIPILSTYVDLNSYSKKLESTADCFEYWSNQSLIGLLAIYKIANSNSVFITNMSLIHNYFGKGYAHILINSAVSFYRNEGFSNMELEVDVNNIRAIKFYAKNLFKIENNNGKKLFMKRNLK